MSDTPEPAASPEGHAELPERYEDAAAELEAIVERMEAGDTPVDELDRDARRAAALVRHCRTILDGATQRVDQALAELDPPAQPDARSQTPPAPPASTPADDAPF